MKEVVAEPYRDIDFSHAKRGPVPQAESGKTHHERYVSDEKIAEIRGEIDQLERREEVRVLYAVESGSRAWGFPSRDSDYDVRFIYARRQDWYLSVDLELRRDVLEVPITDDLDLSGWDLRKALRLFAKSNPPLLEWLSSPVVYVDADGFAERLRGLIPLYHREAAKRLSLPPYGRGKFSGLPCVERLSGSRNTCMFSARFSRCFGWSKEGVRYPMEFSAMYSVLGGQEALVEAIQALVHRKRAGEELDEGPRIPLISAFIESELARLAAYSPQKSTANPSFEPLNQLFRDVLRGGLAQAV